MQFFFYPIPAYACIPQHLITHHHSSPGRLIIHHSLYDRTPLQMPPKFHRILRSQSRGSQQYRYSQYRYSRVPQIPDESHPVKIPSRYGAEYRYTPSCPEIPIHQDSGNREYWDPWIRITTGTIARRISSQIGLTDLVCAAGIRRISGSEILPAGSRNQQHAVPVLILDSCTAVILYKNLSNPFNFIRLSSFTKLNIEINHFQT